MRGMQSRRHHLSFSSSLPHISPLLTITHFHHSTIPTSIPESRRQGSNLGLHSLNNIPLQPLRALNCPLLRSFNLLARRQFLLTGVVHHDA